MFYRYLSEVKRVKLVQILHILNLQSDFPYNSCMTIFVFINLLTSDLKSMVLILLQSVGSLFYTLDLLGNQSLPNIFTNNSKI